MTKPASPKPTNKRTKRRKPPIRLTTVLAKRMGWSPERDLIKIKKGLEVIAEDKGVDPEVRVRAYAEIRTILTSGWLPHRPVTLVRELTGDDDQDSATIASSALKAVASGQLGTRQGGALVSMANRTMDSTGLARLLREAAPLSPTAIAAQVVGPERAAQAVGLTAEDLSQVNVPTAQKALPHPRRPVWRTNQGGVEPGAEPGAPSPPGEGTESR